MQDNEIMNIWKSYDQKLEQALIVNQQLTRDVTKLKVSRLLSKTSRTKKIILLVAIPYLFILVNMVIIGFRSGSVFFTIGFGAIAFLNTVIVISYLYHIFLISKIDSSDSVLEVQETLSRLKISSFKITRLALLQIPFWSVCWISLDALKNSLLIYGLTNLVVFFVLCYLTFWLYTNVSIHKMDNKLNKLFFKGFEWDPIIKSISILEQIDEYKSEQ